MAAQWSRCGRLVFACGRYEGIDARVADEARARMPVDEVTIGDYVLAGGEPAVLVMVEALCRLLPGVLGNAESAADDSFGGGAGPMAGLSKGRVHAAPGLARTGSPAGPAVRRSRGHCPLAARSGAAADRCEASRPGRPAGRRTGPASGSTHATARYSLKLAFRSVAKIWQTEVCHPTRRPCGCASWCPQRPGRRTDTDETMPRVRWPVRA